MAENEDTQGRANYIKALEAMLYTAKQLEPYTRAGLKFVHDDTRKTIDAKHHRAPFNSLCMCYMLDNKN